MNSKTVEEYVGTSEQYIGVLEREIERLRESEGNLRAELSAAYATIRQKARAEKDREDALRVIHALRDEVERLKSGIEKLVPDMDELTYWLLYKTDYTDLLDGTAKCAVQIRDSLGGLIGRIAPEDV